MESKKKREGVCAEARRLRKCFSTFTPCSRRISPCVDCLRDDERHWVTPLLALQRLQL